MCLSSCIPAPYAGKGILRPWHFMVEIQAQEKLSRTDACN